MNADDQPIEAAAPSQRFIVTVTAEVSVHASDFQDAATAATAAVRHPANTKTATDYQRRVTINSVDATSVRVP